MLPKGLRLYIADILDEETKNREFWFVVGRTYQSAYNRFVKCANATWTQYAYYFYEADDDTKAEFIESHENISAGIYDA